MRTLRIMSLQYLDSVNRIKLTSQVISTKRSDLSILTVLENYGYIRGYTILSNSSSNTNCFVKIFFGYFDSKPLIKKIVFYNTTGYHKKKNIYFDYQALADHVKNSPGLYIISTPIAGVISHKEALIRKIGGTLLAYVE